jgi:hypothetical protein
MEKDIAEAKMPDFRKLVTERFVERAKIEISNWPTMDVEEKAVKVDFIKDFLNNKSAYIMIIQVPIYSVNTWTGFWAGVRADIKDSKDTILWGKHFMYRSEKYKRTQSVDEYKADNFKLLREEMSFAAETVVSELIQDLTKGKSTANK